MAVAGVGTPVRGSGKSQDKWKLEWTYGADNSVTLDAAQSDQDQRIAEPVADSGPGEVLITFPSCDRAWVEHVSLEPATPGTGNRQAIVHTMNAPAGTCRIAMCQSSDDAPTDPVTGARGRLTLMLERP